MSIMKPTSNEPQKKRPRGRKVLLIGAITLLALGSIAALIYMKSIQSVTPVTGNQGMSTEQIRQREAHYYKVTSVVKVTLKQVLSVKNELLVTLEDGNEKTYHYDASLTITKGIKPGAVPIGSLTVGSVIYITYNSELDRALSIWIDE